MNTKLIPFNLEKAKAGAKVVYYNNHPIHPDHFPVTIVTFEGRGEFPVIGYIGEETNITSWTKEGRLQILNRGSLFLSIPTFPDPPEGEVYHNPYNLTPEEVGEGYRLLLRSEIKKREGNKLIEIFRQDWVRAVGDGFKGSNMVHTYRIPAFIPFHWDAPKKSLSYIPFTYVTALPHLGKAIKSKDGTRFAVITNLTVSTVGIGCVILAYSELFNEFTFLDGAPCGTEQKK